MGTILHMRRIYNPHVERAFVFNPHMDKRSPKDVLADNIRALMGDTTYAAFPAKVADGTINRVLAGQNVRLSTLDALARGFKLQAWELLCPALDPENPPARQLEELDELRQWRDEVMERARQTQHGRMVDAGGPNGADGNSKGKGKQQEGRYKGTK